MNLLKWISKTKTINENNVEVINQLIHHFIKQGKLDTETLQHLVNNNFITPQQLDDHLREDYPKQFENIYNSANELKIFYDLNTLLNFLYTKSYKKFRDNDIINAIMSCRKNSDWIRHLLVYNNNLTKNTLPHIQNLKNIINKIIISLISSLDFDKIIKNEDELNDLIQLFYWKKFHSLIPDRILDNGESEIEWYRKYFIEKGWLTPKKINDYFNN